MNIESWFGCRIIPLYLPVDTDSSRIHTKDLTCRGTVNIKVGYEFGGINVLRTSEDYIGS